MHSQRLAVRTRGLMSFTGLAWAVAACGDPVSPLTPTDVVGTYALQSIDGHVMPAPYGQGTALIYDTLVVARDSTFVDRGGAGALGSSLVTYPLTYGGRWMLDAAGGRLVTTSDAGHGVVDTVTFKVVNRGTSLTFDAGPVNPSDPGGGLWVYNRVQ